MFTKIKHIANEFWDNLLIYTTELEDENKKKNVNSYLENEMDKWVFFLAHLACYAVLSFVFDLIFPTVFDLDKTESSLLFDVILVFFLTLGYFSTYDNNRNKLSLTFTILLPVEFCCYISTIDIKKISVVFCSLIFSVWIFIMMMVFNYLYNVVRAKNRDYYRFFRRVKEVGNVLKLVFIVSFALVLFMNYTGGIGGTTEDSSPKALNTELSAISNIKEARWRELATDEKLQVLQRVADIQANALGLPFTLEVKVVALQEHVLASYHARSHVIKIDVEHFNNNSAGEIIESLLHESRHAYQRCLCDVASVVPEQYKNLEVFNITNILNSEFKDYNKGFDDFDRYEAQLCEKDAREYASAMMAHYYYAILA